MLLLLILKKGLTDYLYREIISFLWEVADCSCFDCSVITLIC